MLPVYLCLFVYVFVHKYVSFYRSCMQASACMFVCCFANMLMYVFDMRLVMDICCKLGTLVKI